MLQSLDLSSNAFGNDGSDELAWVVTGAESLVELSLADCGVTDEAADEWAEALQALPSSA